MYMHSIYISKLFCIFCDLNLLFVFICVLLEINSSFIFQGHRVKTHKYFTNARIYISNLNRKNTTSIK